MSNLARTVCRRTERGVVRRRLSDLLWLFARKLELDAGVNSSLRAQTGKDGNRWSRAW